MGQRAEHGGYDGVQYAHFIQSLSKVFDLVGSTVKMVRAAILASLLAVATGALAERRFVPGAYIFEVEDGHDPAAVAQQVVGKHGTTRMKLNYKHFKGVSVQLHDLKGAKDTAASLASAPSIKRAWPIEIHDLPDDHPSKVFNLKDWNITDAKLTKRDVMNETDTWSTHVMTQVDKLRAKGVTGKGIKLAVVDTGVDYSLAPLGGCFGAGCRVSFGYDLVGDDYTGSNEAVPDPDPMDCAGHGTHVSGIIVAKDDILHWTGAAPDVTFGMYRVFGCPAEGAADDVLIAAFNMAFEDGADVITASIGGSAGWSESAWSVAVERLVEAGVVCTLAAGNDGGRALFDASEAADGKGVTAVASFENVVSPYVGYGSTYRIDGGGDEMHFGYNVGNVYNWKSPPTAMPLYATSLDFANTRDACDPLPDSTPDLSGYLVLIHRGTCYYSVKAANALAKGAQYIMFYESAFDVALGTINVQDTNITAVGFTTARQGMAWVDAINAGRNVTVTMELPSNETVIVSGDERDGVGGCLSPYTSWGPSWDMDAKPQVGAPGGLIWSTYYQGYAVLSGTSMATPLMASVMALVLQVRGTTTPRALDNLVSSNANPQLWNDGSGFRAGALAPVPQQGAGLVQAYDAAYATTLLDPSSLSFNDTDHFVKSFDFVITNKGSSTVTYNVTHVPALTAYTMEKGTVYPKKFPPDLVDTAAKLTFSTSQITLSAGNRKIISVSAQPPEGVESKRLPVWSGYIAINGTDGTSLSLPYQGVSGSLKGTASLPAGQGWIAWSNDTKPLPNHVPDNYTFTLPAPGTATTKNRLPMLYFNLALGTRLMRVDVVPMTTCRPKNLTTDDPLGDKYKVIGEYPGFPVRWWPRGSAKMVWDGQLDSGDYAPAGKYKFLLRALRVFGDESKLADWDVVETQGFKIKYST
ncbi:subtilisin-like serine protease PR1C [Purpureocillium lavendulum]|uniref:Subtilisin-like serine protease PR1C n=1 Tax=Purpureocillium lavendulum TaxID=1247861 RepID=A0AB34FKX9_9HYPO|nr:subtilisin-like serine protease PR1C [Purpureocillium lavendulum]